MWLPVYKCVWCVGVVAANTMLFIVGISLLAITNYDITLYKYNQYKCCTDIVLRKALYLPLTEDTECHIISTTFAEDAYLLFQDLETSSVLMTAIQLACMNADVWDSDSGFASGTYSDYERDSDADYWQNFLELKI